ncbi:MAG: hypothetical protein C0398_07285 [Coprothermobacter sp.]|nr:hypothetical protein [Coprothermobacter sp.]
MSGQVTILLATHNGHRWLAPLVHSIQEQTYPDWRLMVLDDGSTDDTPELTRDLLEREKRAVLQVSTLHRGAVGTFEELLSTVSTPYFALCDQDDVWQPRKLEESVELLERTGTELVYTDLVVVDEDLCQVAASMWKYSQIVPVRGKALIPLLLRNAVTGCTIVGRTALLTRALPFPPGIPMHDWWLAVVAASGRGVEPLTHPSVLYRQHGQNELGASALSLSSLRRRQSRQGGSLSQYLDGRIQSRLAMVMALRAMGIDREPRFLSWFYRRTGAVRFVVAPVYFIYALTHAGILGVRALGVDLMLSCWPVGVTRTRLVTGGNNVE